MAAPPDRVQEGIELWAALRPDLDPSGTEVVARVLRLSVIFRAAIAATLARAGVGLGEYSVLAILRSRGGEECELPPKILADATHVTSGGITNLIARMEAAGLVDRRPDPGDGRGRIVRLTAAGKALIDDVVADVGDAERELVAGIDEPERALLAQGLSGLLLSLDRPGGGVPRRRNR